MTDELWDRKTLASPVYKHNDGQTLTNVLVFAECLQERRANKEESKAAGELLQRLWKEREMLREELDTVFSILGRLEGRHLTDSLIAADQARARIRKLRKELRNA